MPSLTLRKPSAPSPDAVAAFIGNDEADPVSPPAPRPAPAPALRTVPTRPPAGAPSEDAAIAAPATGPAPMSSAAPSFRRASRAIVERRTRAARRRTTVYLDVDVAIRLAGFLHDRDQELSDTVNAAVRAWIDAPPRNPA
jgi:hypothetical protein